MLKIENLESGYSQANCLKGISLKVEKGEIVALLGANGAGKSTTLMTISGLVSLRGGRILYDSDDISCIGPVEVVRRGISHVPEGRRVLPNMSVLENLELGAYLERDKAIVMENLTRSFELFPILADRKNQLSGTLSGGEQQMLAIARGLMAKPKLLLLDEPSLGLAPKLVQDMFQTIQRINREGVTILLVEQNAYGALQIANRGYVMETGRITLTDTAENLSKNPQVKAAYLGG